VLSRLYGSEIDVVRLKGRVFVMSGGHDVERDGTATTIGPCMRTISKEYIRAMLDYDFMQNAFDATVVTIVSGLARGATECRLAGRSLREHEDRWFGIEHALARRDRKR
jgi:hypothetical protein